MCPYCHASSGEIWFGVHGVVHNRDHYSLSRGLHPFLSDRGRVFDRDFDVGGVCGVVRSCCLNRYLTQERLILGLRIAPDQRAESDCARAAEAVLTFHSVVA